MESVINGNDEFKGRNVGYYLAISPIFVASLFFCWYLASYHWSLFIVGAVASDAIIYYVYSLARRLLSNRFDVRRNVNIDILLFSFQAFTFSVVFLMYHLL